MRSSLAILAVSGLMLLGGCHSEPDHCRYDPSCAGGVGGFCHGDGDCDEGHCCTESANCAGGVCTYRCSRDADCPTDMACAHGVCFFRCDSDDDCADGMSCEHGNTICEWP